MTKIILICATIMFLVITVSFLLLAVALVGFHLMRKFDDWLGEKFGKEEEG